MSVGSEGKAHRYEDIAINGVIAYVAVLATYISVTVKELHFAKHCLI